MQRHLKNTLDVLKSAAESWLSHNASRKAAALAYYTIFSAAPILILAISIAGIFFSQESVQTEIIFKARDLIGAGGAEAVEGLLTATYETGSGTIATIAALLTLFWGASNLFNQFKSILNDIWEVPTENEGFVAGIINFIRSRLLSIAMVLIVGFLLLVTLILSAAVSAFINFASGVTPLLSNVLQLADLTVSLTVVTILFAMIYKFLPDARITWGDVFIGAGVTALLFTIGQWAIGLYIGNSSVASAYGAAGSLVVMLLWVYYSVQILLFGAEFTKVYAHRYGSHTSLSYMSRASDDDGVSTYQPPPPPEPYDILPSHDISSDERVVIDNAKPQIVGEKSSSGIWFSGFLSGLAVIAAGMVMTALGAIRRNG